MNQRPRLSNARRKDKKSRFIIDNEFFNDGYAAFLGRSALVYFALAKYANAETQNCYPGYETIMRETGIKNKSKIFAAITTLEELKMIHVEHSKGRAPNIYHLLDSDCWKLPNSIPVETDRTVTKRAPKPSQKSASNRLDGDTGNQRMKSTKEITTIEPTEGKKKSEFLKALEEKKIAERKEQLARWRAEAEKSTWWHNKK